MLSFLGGSEWLASAKRPGPGNRVALAFLVGLSIGAGPGWGEGLRSPTAGAQGLGSSGGRMVFVDDASAVTHNPANLVDLQGWEASFEPTVAYHSVSYRSPTGARAETVDPWKFLPHVFAGGPLGSGTVAAGLGVTAPYGLSVVWDADPGDPFRYAAPYHNELETLSVNPTLAFKLHPKVRLGVGLDVLWSELTLKQYYPWATIVPGAPDGRIVANGDGIGWGANLGLSWDIAERHRLAFGFRSPIDVNYEGDLRISNAVVVPGGRIHTDMDSRIEFPTTLSVGYGFRVSDRVRLEANLEWLEFSRFEELNLDVPAALPGLNTRVREDWEDTITVGAGGSWEFAEGWTLRFSYQYFESPVPEFTYSPSIPDANQHAVTVGLCWRAGHHRLEAAYGRVFYEDRSIGSNQSGAYLGRYDIEVHLVSLAYGFTF